VRRTECRNTPSLRIHIKTTPNGVYRYGTPVQDWRKNRCASRQHTRTVETRRATEHRRRIFVRTQELGCLCTLHPDTNGGRRLTRTGTVEIQDATETLDASTLHNHITATEAGVYRYDTPIQDRRKSLRIRRRHTCTGSR